MSGPFKFEDLPEEPKAAPEVKESGNPKADLVSRVYGMRFHPDDIPPEEESCLFIGGEYPIAARGNLTAIQGQAKAGKSAVVSAILGAVIRGNHATQGDVFEFEWKGPSQGAIIHADTEQSPSDWHALVRRSITRSGMPTPCERLQSFPLVTLSRGERLAALEEIMKIEADRLGVIDCVLVDGIADLCRSPNDEIESLELVSRILALSHDFDCLILSVLHENPSSENGKTRGHLGSELQRKAFANLRIDKDPQSLVSTIFGTSMRKRDLPKDQGFCFAWDDAAMMHTYQGRHAGLKAARADAEKREKEREFFEPIFAPNGTKGACPKLSAKEALSSYRDTNGTGEEITEAAMKKRLQRAENLGVLRKAGRGVWTINPNGTNGT